MSLHYYAHQLLPPTSTPITPSPYKPFPYYNLELVQWSLLFGICLFLGIGMGGNDVADSFGTSVGTRTITITQAFVLATVVEMMGSMASGIFGYAGRTLDLIDNSSFTDDPDQLVLGQVAMLIGCATWLLIATFYSMPVSAIHSILGATIGFVMVLRGWKGIIWWRVGVVALTWIVTPIASAICTLITFSLINVIILRSRNPVKNGLFLLPLIYLIVIFTCVFLLLQDGSRLFQFQTISFLAGAAISLGVGAIAGLIVLFVVGPYLKKRLEKPKSLPTISRDTFSIQPTVLTACFSGFAHGANDVTNCVAPMRNLIKLYNQDYQETTTNLNIGVFIGLLCSLSLLLGIWILGIRVVRTVGEELSEMNPATGFSVEFGAAFVALVTNIYSIPQSMTHCLVASIFALGLVRSGPILRWRTVKHVFFSWILTIPMSALISAAVMFAIQIFIDFYR